MSEPKLTQQDVQELLKLVESASHVTDFSLRYGDVEVRLSRHGNAGQPPVAQERGAPDRSPASAPAAPLQSVHTAKGQAEVAAGLTAIKAPMVGTFYRAPAPGATPFVEIGQKVKPDSVVCIIEVMKLMSSISAGISGTVKEIRVADSEPVQFGQVLIVIQPDA
jgi:acetyl-CoA carboxylase biotin carboxyl carrier protein